MERIRIKTDPRLKPLADCISLKGKTALITGAASGIGRSISLRFAEASADLLLVDIDEKGLAVTAGLLEKFNCTKKNYVVDLSRKSEIDDFWDRLIGDAGAGIPDIIINNAGIYPFKNYLQVNEAFYARTLEINLNSVFWMCQNFIRKRGKLGGIIVNVSSIEAVVPFKEDLAHYSISKSGVIALTRSLSRDYGRKGFRVNGVLPGAIKTPGTGTHIKNAILKLQLNLIKTSIDFNARLTAGRWGNPDEVARVVLFLSSDLSSYVHGVMLPVDGGFLAS
jgi:3-oxoacyl-[acyl-carrier protein] reductase